jgi:hypothetical protein
MSKSKFKENDNVIFKQRTARHLAVHENLAWEYESGTIILIDRKAQTVNVCWLQGHHSRNDDVPFEDITAVYDPKGEHLKIGSFTGKSRLLHKIVKEGS